MFCLSKAVKTQGTNKLAAINPATIKEAEAGGLATIHMDSTRQQAEKQFYPRVYIRILGKIEKMKLRCP